MNDEKPEGGLSAAENAFFDSGGNVPLEPEKPADGLQTENQTPPETVEPDGSVNVRDDKGRFVKTIPFDVFHAEREQHKQTKAEMAELREFKGRMEERWQLLASAAQQTEQKPVDQDPEPDPNTDIFAHNAWLKRQIDGFKKTQTDRDQSEKQAKEASEGEARVWNYWNETAKAYKAENPEFEDAVKFMSDARTKQLKSLSGLHPQLRTEAGIVQQINSELHAIIVAAAQNGVSPAKYVFDMAKEWGYAGKQPPANEALTLPAELARVATAQAASRTVGAAPGAATGAELTLQQIVDMPQGEFKAWMADPKNSRRYDKLMGA